MTTSKLFKVEHAVSVRKSGLGVATLGRTEVQVVADDVYYADANTEGLFKLGVTPRGRVPGGGVHRLRRVGGGRRGGVRRAGLRLQQRRRGQRRGPRRRGAATARRVRPRLRLRLHLPRPGQHARGLGLRRRHVQRPRRERAADRGRGRRLRGGLPGRGGPGAAPGGDGHDGAQLDDGRALRGRREVPRARRPRPHRRVGRRVPPLHGRGDGDARHGRPARAGAGRGPRRDRRRHPGRPTAAAPGRSSGSRWPARAGRRVQDRHAGPRRLRLRGGLRRPAPRERGPAGDRRRGVGPVRGLVGPRRRPRARRHHDVREGGSRCSCSRWRPRPRRTSPRRAATSRSSSTTSRTSRRTRSARKQNCSAYGGSCFEWGVPAEVPEERIQDALNMTYRNLTVAAPADHRGAQRLRRRSAAWGYTYELDYVGDLMSGDLPAVFAVHNGMTLQEKTVYYNARATPRASTTPSSRSTTRAACRRWRPTCWRSRPRRSTT